MTTEIDAEAWFGAKLAAMRAHATQISVSPPYFALTNNIQQQSSGTECYTLLAGPRQPAGKSAGQLAGGQAGRETDLFG